MTYEINDFLAPEAEAARPRASEAVGPVGAWGACGP